LTPYTLREERSLILRVEKYRYREYTCAHRVRVHRALVCRWAASVKERIVGRVKRVLFAHV